MTGDLLICKIAGAILLALFLVLARLLTVTKQAAAPPEPPEKADEPETDGDFYFRVTREKITTGAFARR
jgi:hypothetical protein